MTEVYEDERYYYGGEPINTSLMCAILCKIHGWSGHHGLCVISSKPIPPDIFREVMETIKGTDHPQPLPGVVLMYEAAVA